MHRVSVRNMIRETDGYCMTVGNRGNVEGVEWKGSVLFC